MILKTYFHRLRNSEIIQFLIDALSICKQQNPGQLQIANKVDDLQVKTTALDSVYKLAQKSAITDTLVQLDERRDTYFTGIKLYAEGMTYHYDPGTSQAARIILDSIDHYGKNIPKQNYQAETSTINSLIGDWTNNKKLADAINKIRLVEWAKELKTANDQFNKSFLSRVEEKASQPQTSSFELQKNAIKSYKELIKHIEARATVANNNSYDVLINQLNVLIDKYNKIANGHSANDKEDDSATPSK